MYVIVLAIGGWATNRAIDHGFIIGISLDLSTHIYIYIYDCMCLYSYFDHGSILISDCVEHGPIFNSFIEPYESQDQL